MQKLLTLVSLLVAFGLLMAGPALAATYPNVTGVWTGSLHTDGKWIADNGSGVYQGYPNTQPVTLKVTYQSAFIYSNNRWAFISGTLTTAYFDDWGGTIHFWGYVYRGGAVNITFVLGTGFTGSFTGSMTQNSALLRTLNGTWTYNDSINRQVGTMGLSKSLMSNVPHTRPSS